MKNPFHGLGVALITPFTAEQAVDYDALEELVDSLLKGGADFLCILGTTAETPCLENDEKQEIIRRIVEQNNGRVPLLLGCGNNNTASVVQYLKETDLNGIDGVLIVTPYYNKPSQEGLYQHFSAVAAATDKPVVLYNVPGRTGVNLQASTTLRIAGDCPNVVAIKEASGKLDQIETIIQNAPDGFEVLSGDDAVTFELLSLGAVGVISVIGNAYPEAFGTMVHAVLKENMPEALALHRKLHPLYSLMTADGNPAGIKSLLTAQGKIKNVLRLPLVPATTATLDAIKEYAAAFKEE